MVGENVSRVEYEPGSDTIKMTSGVHGIKISKEKATELDDAAGIISDYIPVIPGNYDFTYRVKLKDIKNNRSRSGVRLHDAIVVRVFFFDAGRQPINPGYSNPVNGGVIDNSDKSYSFANYWRIDDFSWGTVRGRSYNYPFSEGDIPDETRYVRLFFGLKGSGDLWLDDIDYRYSKWNFTVLERFKPFFDKQLPVQERLIPTPKNFQVGDDISYFKAGSPASHLPVIILPDNPAPAEKAAAKILQKRIGAVLTRLTSVEDEGDQDIRILDKGFHWGDISDAELIFSLGSNKLYRKVRPDLPLQSIRDKAQGYIIQTERTGGSHVVFLMGTHPIGNYYAAATARQLFDNNALIYHDATIVDYPDFSGRSYVFKNWNDTKELQRDLDAVERMSLYKFNKVYFGYNRQKKDWYRPDTLYRQGLQKAGRVLNGSGVMSLALMVNPYSHFAMGMAAERLDDRLRYIWTHSSPESFRMLTDILSIGLEAGARTVMLLSDDFVPHGGSNFWNYDLFTAEDKRRFVNLQNAQAHVINNLKIWLDANYPATRLEFCPPWYSNEHIDRSEGKAETYFKELIFQIPRDVAVIWTGPTIRSLSIDQADLDRYASLINRWPMIWDNTLYARNLETKRYGGYPAHYPGKVRMCNIFEPFDTYRPENFQVFNDSRHMYVNGSAYSEVYKIKYMTVADYEWNTTAYDPELSLWKALCNTYGPECARLLIRFSDTYYRLYGICSRLETEGPQDEYIKNGQNCLIDLNGYLRDISQSLSPSHPLFEELQKNRDRQEARFEKLCSHP